MLKRGRASKEVNSVGILKREMLLEANTKLIHIRFKSLIKKYSHPIYKLIRKY